MVWIVALVPAQLHAQIGSPRSLEYLTASMGNDVRASFANPAGLAVTPEASVMGEIRIDKPDNGSSRLGQVTLGLNSRGFSLVYQKDRFISGLSGSTWRLSIANQFNGGAIGVSYTLYKGSGPSDTGFDVGVRLFPTPNLDIGFVARNIGRPALRRETLDPTAVSSISFLPIRNLRVSGEILAADLPGSGGLEFTYRALVLISEPSGFTSVFGSVTLNDNASLGRFSLGVSFGTPDQLMATSSFDRIGGSTGFEAVSLTGASVRRFVPAGR